MRKSSIKSIYHWSIMGLVMGMPLIITACSYIPNSYNDNNVVEYSTREFTPVTELVNNDVYYLDLNNPTSGSYNALSVVSISNMDITYDTKESNTLNNLIVYNGASFSVYFGGFRYGNVKGSLEYVFTSSTSGDYSRFIPISYKFEDTTHEVINNGAYQVWQYNKKLLDLPINQWYSSLLDLTIGKPSEFTPISNVVVFPLYAIWVLIFDLAFDVLAFIPKLAHTWCDKLGGEEE